AARKPGRRNGVAAEGRIPFADRDDRAASAAARELRSERAVLARDIHELLELGRRYLQCVEHPVADVHELAQELEIVVLNRLHTAQCERIDLVENALVELLIFLPGFADTA